MLQKTHSADEISSLIESLRTNPGQIDVVPADQALLEYALKLTHQPSSIDQQDIANLRLHGFNDLAIHDLACCVGYFAFVNRIADGLGVKLESE